MRAALLLALLVFAPAARAESHASQAFQTVNIGGQTGGALAITVSSPIVLSGQVGGAFATTSTNTVISTGTITVFPGADTVFRVDRSSFVAYPSSAPVRIADASGIGFTSTAIDAKVALDIFMASASATIPIQRHQANALKYFSTTSNFVTLANSAETPLFLFVNLSTNTKCAYLESHRLSFAASNTGNGVAKFRIYRNAVITSSGTAMGIFSGRPGSGAVSQMQAYASPTTSSDGQVVYSISSIGSGTNIPINQSRIFCPGTSFLVTVANPANNFSDSYDIEWSEE